MKWGLNKRTTTFELVVAIVVVVVQVVRAAMAVEAFVAV